MPINNLQPITLYSHAYFVSSVHINTTHSAIYSSFLPILQDVNDEPDQILKMPILHEAQTPYGLRVLKLLLHIFITSPQSNSLKILEISYSPKFKIGK